MVDVGGEVVGADDELVLGIRFRRAADEGRHALLDEVAQLRHSIDEPLAEGEERDLLIVDIIRDRPSRGLGLIDYSIDYSSSEKNFLIMDTILLIVSYTCR